MKVGIIRCQQTEDMCSGTTDFKVAQMLLPVLRKSFEQSGQRQSAGLLAMQNRFHDVWCQRGQF